MKTLPLPLALWLAITSLVFPLAAQKLELEKSLADLDFKFYYDLAELQKPIDELLNQYLQALRVAKNECQQAGDLKAVLAFEQEIEEVKPKELGERTEWRAPENPLIIKKRQKYLTEHTAIVTRNFKRNFDAAIAISRGYAEQLNALVKERTKAGKLQEAQVFQARLDELRIAVTTYKQPDKPAVKITAWVKETLDRMPQRLQPAGAALPKLGKKTREAGEERKIELTKDVSMTFCWCPAGKFTMGSPKSEADRRDDENQVEVTLSKGFWMAKTEVTQAQWQAVMGENPSRFQGVNRPVEQVSWDDAQKFLTKLNSIVGDSDGGKMILPTEAQWEYAARAGEKGPYSGGTLDEVAWYDKNSGGETHPVGTKKPNAWGLHDLHGNVEEWCMDWYVGELAGGVDPQGAASGSNRVFRGGGGDNGADICSVARRFNGNPSYSGDGIGFGFRVARSSVP